MFIIEGSAEGGSPARRFPKTDLTKVNYEKNIDGGIVFRGPYRAHGVLFKLVRARMPARGPRVPRGAVCGVPVPSSQKCGGLPCRQSVPRGTGVSGGVSRCSAELPARKVARIESPRVGGFFCGTPARYLARAGSAVRPRAGISAFFAAFDAS